MRLSDDKIDHLADRILQRLLALEEEDDSVMVMAEDGELRASVRRSFIEFLQRDEKIHEKVRRKIASMKRGIPEGSEGGDGPWRVVKPDGGDGGPAQDPLSGRVLSRPRAGVSARSARRPGSPPGALRAASRWT